MIARVIRDSNSAGAMPDYEFQMVDSKGECFKSEQISLSDIQSAWQRAFEMAKDADTGSEVRVLDENDKIVIALGAFKGVSPKS
jgi:hypothetical protein